MTVKREKKPSNSIESSSIHVRIYSSTVSLHYKYKIVFNLML